MAFAFPGTCTISCVPLLSLSRCIQWFRLGYCESVSSASTNVLSMHCYFCKQLRFTNWKSLFLVGNVITASERRGHLSLLWSKPTSIQLCYTNLYRIYKLCIFGVNPTRSELGGNSGAELCSCGGNSKKTEVVNTSQIIIQAA